MTVPKRRSTRRFSCLMAMLIGCWCSPSSWGQFSQRESAKFSPNGQYFSTITGNKLEYFTVGSDETEKTFLADFGEIDSQQFSADGHWVGLFSESGRLTLWSPDNEQTTTSIELGAPPLEFGFSSDNTSVFTVSKTGQVQWHRVPMACSPRSGKWRRPIG